MTSRPAALAALVLVLAACSSSGASSAPPSASGAPSSPPSVEPSASPATVGALEHKTGPTDVILRYEEGGGFMIPAWTAAQAPAFTLYGDGTLIFRNTNKEAAACCRIGHAAPPVPDREDERGADPDAARIRARRGWPRGRAGRVPGHDGLRCLDRGLHGQRGWPGQDRLGVRARARARWSAGSPRRKTLAKLRDHLVDIDQGGSVQTDVYAPERYRAYLLEGQPGAPDQKAWPWPEIKPADFVSNGDPNALQMPARVMTAAEIEALGIEPFQGGFIGLPLAGPDDGKFYALTVRPLLPEDELGPSPISCRMPPVARRRRRRAASALDVLAPDARTHRCLARRL